ncbi:rDNA transcriptional regulator pol5 [Magnolia sinica]|uniref:rDNA transcriptional regulator pol5 n=1 Tax=Magnolia sinica TaxID=86752 RepID=UPI002657EC13|nr:rDNA transcriptional regulator pol5 [Magnolia sinica]XP_058069515.1 rDNA transcriptional regulator pol5 [Magnolia sinica]
MGRKKRNSDSVEGSLDQNDAPVDEVPQREKKARKEKTEEEDAGGGTPCVIPHSLKPMEKRKKRKTMIKERNQTNSNTPEPSKVRNLIKGPDVSQAPSPSSVLPEFHVGVFRDLASADLSVRESAAEALVTELWSVQKVYQKLGKKGSNEDEAQLEAEKDDGLKNCAPSLRYAIRRLIRGVSSSRECARQGFALGLTVIVGTIPSIKVDSLMKLIVDLLEVSSSMKGQEARDCLLGRLFAYGALARSGRISDEWISDSNTPTVKEFIGHVISLAAKKRYLREPAVSVVLELVEKLPVEALLSQVLEAPGMHDWFQSATDIGNPDALFLALKIREKIAVDSEAWSKLLPFPFSPNNLFTVDHLSSLSSCFKESTFCQPRVHSVWPMLVNILVPDIASQEEDVSSGSSSNKKHKRSRRCSSSEEDITNNIRYFCEVVIEGCLLMSSHDRKHLAFDVLLLLLPRLPTSCVHIILSHKLVHCLMDILSTNDSWLYKAAQFFLKEVSNWISNDDDRRVAVVVALQKHSSGKFDCVTRSHTVKDLVAEFKTGSGCMQFVQSLMNMFVDEGRPEDEPSDQSQTTDENSEMGSSEDKDSGTTSGNSDFLKNWVIDSLPRVLKNLRLDFEAKSWVQKEIMKFLAVQGLFSASLGTEVTSFELQEKFKWPQIATSTALCKMCIEQLQLLLADAQRGEGSQAVSSGLESNDLGSYFMRFLGTLCNIPSVSLFRPLSNEDEKAFKKLQAMDTRLSREEWNNGPGADANKVHALRYLLIQLLLQVLLRPGEFSEAASELVICCKKAFAAPALLDSSGEEDEFDDNGMPELMDVLVDTLLSLLPQSSGPMCFAVEQVFRFFCDDITDAGLLQMLRVIKKDLKPARHQAMDNVADDDDEDLLGIEEAEDETDEADAAETGDSDDHADDSEEMPRVEQKVEEHPASDDSDGGMDDDAMFRMDSYLAQMFKERKNSMGSETAHSQLVLFKLRVLSLLEIYLHRNPGKPQVLTIFSYLAQAFVNSHVAEGSKQLGQRIGAILQRKILKAKEYPKDKEIQLSTLESMLEKSLKSASRTRHKLVASFAQNSTFWILKIIQARNFPKPELQKVLEIFQHILVDYFDSKKCRLKSGFVKEVFRRYPWVAHELFRFLLEKCGSAKSEYRRVEALDLVNRVLKSCIPGKGDGDKERASALKFWKAHLSSLCDLIQRLLSKQLEKQSRRAEVRRFCSRTLDAVLLLKLDKPFVEALKPDAYAACESQLGDLFLPFKKLGKQKG